MLDWKKGDSRNARTASSAPCTYVDASVCAYVCSATDSFARRSLFGIYSCGIATKKGVSIRV